MLEREVSFLGDYGCWRVYELWDYRKEILIEKEEGEGEEGGDEEVEEEKDEEEGEEKGEKGNKHLTMLFELESSREASVFFS